MIPEEKSAAVTRGLREAFGVSECEDMRMMTKGHTTAIVLRIVVRGKAYLLRIIMRPNAKIGPARHFNCMKAAADAGVAPRVWYTSVEDEISITDFVEEVPFPRNEALVLMPAALRTLHALAPFPGVEDAYNTTCTFLLNKGTAVEDFIGKFQAAKVLSKEETEKLLGWHAQVVEAYPHDEENMVSSHNDLFKPDNTLFDGHRVWLVDWEAAFRNDRYVDLAVVSNLAVTNDAEGEIFLKEYFGEPADAYQRARFFVMQQIVHMFYAMVYLYFASFGGPVDWNEKAPEFYDFHRRMCAGEVNLADQRAKVDFGKVHWNKLSENMQGSRFDDALRIVSGRR
jgi:thiamine kinase-like enzyme